MLLLAYPFASEGAYLVSILIADITDDNIVAECLSDNINMDRLSDHIDQQQDSNMKKSVLWMLSFLKTSLTQCKLFS
jgi:hypothetical protein